MSGVPAWVANTVLTAISSSISTDTTSTSFVDVTNSSVSITPTVTSTILLFAFGTGTTRSGDSLVVAPYIDTTKGQESVLKNNDSSVTQDAPMFIMQRKTGVSAGSITCKLQFKSLGGAQVNFYNGNVILVAIPE